MGFTACTQNEDMAPTLKGQEINATFSVGGMQTRVNTLGDGKNWEDKDKLKVSIFTDSDPVVRLFFLLMAKPVPQW